MEYWEGKKLTFSCHTLTHRTALRRTPLLWQPLGRMWWCGVSYPGLLMVPGGGATTDKGDKSLWGKSLDSAPDSDSPDSSPVHLIIFTRPHPVSRSYREWVSVYISELVMVHQFCSSLTSQKYQIIWIYWFLIEYFH